MHYQEEHPPARSRSAAAPTQLPEPRRVLGWVYVVRSTIGLAFLTHALAGFGADLSVPALAGLLAALTLVTGASWYRTHHRSADPSRFLIASQFLFDLLFITIVVALTGGERSFFVPLFILVVGAGALLLPVPLTVSLGGLAGVLYLAGAFLSGGALEPVVLLQAALFLVVAVVMADFGDRLRRAGVALGAVETELRRLRLDTHEILETIGTGILTVDGPGRLAYMNRAAADLLGIDPDGWTDRPILATLDEIAPGLGGVIERTAATRTPIRRFETEPMGEDGFVLGVSATLLDRPGDERPPVTVIFQDITEKKRLEALRRRAERLEAVAELSASLAHEIKNPLASIRSAVEQIAAGRIDEEDGRVLGGLVVRESDRLSRLLGDFIDFARVKLISPQAVDFGSLVQEVATIVRAHPDAHSRGVRVTVSDTAEDVWIRGAEDLLHRAVFNLALNAAQWAGESGTVELSVDEVRSDLLSPALGAFRLIRLVVRDSGPGVPEEIRDHIFDPFYTRRAGGTGLGLALVQRAVEAHGGAIFVDGAPGGGPGAVFTLYLPSLPVDRAEQTAPAPLIEAIAS